MRFPAKNKIQTINEVEEIVDNGKVKITPEDWYALVYAAYQINAIQDLVSTGFNGNAIKNISVRSGAVTSGGSPTFDFTFTYQGVDGQEVTTTANAEIPVSTIPSTPGAEGAVGPKGDSVFIKYSSSADGTGFTNSWTEGQSYIGLSVAQVEPIDKTGYTWVKFIDKRITSMRFNGTDLVFTWSEGPETTVTMQTTDFKTVKPVDGVVTSVNGQTGAVTAKVKQVFFTVEDAVIGTPIEICDIPKDTQFQDLFAARITLSYANPVVPTFICLGGPTATAEVMPNIHTTSTYTSGTGTQWTNITSTVNFDFISKRDSGKISIKISRIVDVSHDLQTNVIQTERKLTDGNKIDRITGYLYFS